jgi:uncharacterized protein Yka (UPF0111/DUF47 family)
MTKMAESVEELATIIKDYAKKNKKFNDRISDLETKIFGQVREGTAKLNSHKRVPQTARDL